MKAGQRNDANINERLEGIFGSAILLLALEIMLDFLFSYIYFYINGVGNSQKKGA